MSRNIKISAVLVGVFLAIVAVVGIAAGGGNDDGARATPTTAATAPADGDAAAQTARVVASDARRLGRAGNSGVTFTEFLDFECEACAAAYPAIEQLRQEYAGRVTFNIRYFPIDGHGNARNAAHAVEAAAQQGELEAMYQRMYETQTQWGEKQTSKAALFRSFAKDLGLDLRRYDAAVASDKTAARVQRDVELGQAVGVQATPTFFINEQRIEPQSFEDLRQQLDAAIAAS